jgi:hypothetical protein
MPRSRLLSRFFPLLFGLVFTPYLVAQFHADPAVIEKRQPAAVGRNVAPHEAILFGGIDLNITDGPALNDTWIWRTKFWEEVQPATRPDPRTSAAMAYDSTRSEVVMFGGLQDHSSRTVGTSWIIVRKYPPVAPGVAPMKGTQVIYRDTWIWNGSDWALRTPAHAPPERYNHAMAYDAARQQIVLFGGMDVSTQKPTNDTWVWNGADWKKMSPSTVPPVRYWQSMAYDPVHEQIVMFGGKDSHGFDMNDTWIWDGSDWADASPPGDVPELRFASGMDFDPILKRVVLIGGQAETPEHHGWVPNDTWTWDGDRWAKLGLAEYELRWDFKDVNAEDIPRTLVVPANLRVARWISRHVEPPPEPVKAQ